jgi:hypothetical protein
VIPKIVFLDCEFTDFIDIDLVSIGMVCEDGNEFYAERSDFSMQDCSEFVRVAVLPLLGESNLRITREALAQSAREWLEDLESVIIFSDSSTDRDLLIDALDGDVPNAVEQWINLQTMADWDVICREAAIYHSAGNHPWHHALHDARALCHGWKFANPVS